MEMFHWIFHVSILTEFQITFLRKCSEIFTSIIFLQVIFAVKKRFTLYYVVSPYGIENLLLSV